MLLTRTQSKPLFRVSDRRRLTFYPAVFNAPTTIHERDNRGDWITYTETIGPGAFSVWLANPDNDVIANRDHDDGQEFARRSGGLLLQEDNFGLFASCWVPDEHDHIIEGVESGELTGCSFRFKPVEDETRADGSIVRKSVELYDVCLTGNPAYAQTHGSVMLRTKAKRDTYIDYLLARYQIAKIK